MSRLQTESASDDESSPARWVNPWGLAALCFIAAAMAQPTLIGKRWLTVLFAATAFAISAQGAWRAYAGRQVRDGVWFGASAILSSVILLLMWLAPEILNSRWGIDKVISKPDPNELTVVPRDKGLQIGRPLSKDEAIDPATEAFCQDDVVIRIESVKHASFFEAQGNPSVQVVLRVVNLSQVQAVSLEGFDEHPPTLSDHQGRVVPFKEQRLKQIKDRAVIFVAWGSQRAVEVAPRGFQDVMLVFQTPPDGGRWLLEVPSSAWGRQGTCRFRLEPPKD